MRIFKDRRFILSFSLSLIVIFTTWGLLKTDYESRATLTGDSSPSFSVVSYGSRSCLKVKALGIDEEYDISAAKKAVEAIKDFFCLPGGSNE